jgi:undecaprenyl-diphosphatase
MTVTAPTAITVPTRTMLARGRPASWLALTGVAGFLAIFGLVRTHRSEAVDLALTLRVQRRRRPWLDRLMGVVSWPGFPPQSRVVPPALIGALLLGGRRREGALLAAGWGTAAVSTLVKALMRRPRPVAGTDLRVVTAPLGGSSFPSGHVITYVGTYGFTAYLAETLLRDQAGRRLIVALLTGGILLVGPSRIYLGHHWPTDVAASYLLGTSYLAVLIAVHRALTIQAVEASPAARVRALVE